MSLLLIARQHNLLLARLSDEAFNHLLSSLELVLLSADDVLFEYGDDCRYTYFPVNAIASLSYDTQNGSAVEICMVGNEGAIGISFLMGGTQSQWRSSISHAGLAYRISAPKMKEQFKLRGELFHIMLLYMQARIAHISMTAVCNRHHNIEQQVCRWLLQSLDRLTSNTILMTQEGLGQKLGVRREGITGVAVKLQKFGALEYHRGKIHIIDRNKLASMSCECYVCIKTEFDRLIPSSYMPINSNLILTRHPSQASAIPAMRAPRYA